MPFAMNRSSQVMPVRPADAARIEVTLGNLGIDRVAIDLGTRDRDVHCLVTFPAIELVVPPATAPTTWLRMRVRYERGSAGDRTPFYLYLIGYDRGVQVVEERTRFFAGAEEALIAIPIRMPTPDEADRFQLVIYADRRLDGKLTLAAPRIVAGEVEHGINPKEPASQPVDLARSWRQEGRRVICRSYFGDHWAEMPAGWRLDEVHPAALAVADWLLYAKVETLAFGVNTPAPDPEEHLRRFPGPGVMLSYSIGTDSTAALSLLPNDIHRYYCKRPYRAYLTPTGAKIELPDQSLWEDRLAGRLEDVMIIPNTFESLQLAAGGRHGFAHNFGYASVGLLLADYLDAGVLAFGSVMEQVFLRSGNLFTDVVALQRSSYNSLRRLFEGAGLFFALPTGGCSEVLTTRITDEGRFAGIAISCPRPAWDGTACGTCFKCFRKLRLERARDLPEPDASVLQTLAKYPLKSATSVVFAAQRTGFRHEALDRYRDVDLGFLERYYPYALEHMLPQDLADHVRGELVELGVFPMTAEDAYRLRTVGQVFWPEQFTWSKAGLPEPAGGRPS